MSRIRPAHRLLLALAPFIGLGAFVAVATGAIPGSNGTINACYATGSGNLRVIDTEAMPAQQCNNKERSLSWNQQGPAGATGPAGPAGPASCDAGRLLVCPDADLPADEVATVFAGQSLVFRNVHTFRLSCTTADKCTVIIAGDDFDDASAARGWYADAQDGIAGLLAASTAPAGR